MPTALGQARPACCLRVSPWKRVPVGGGRRRAGVVGLRGSELLATVADVFAHRLATAGDGVALRGRVQRNGEVLVGVRFNRTAWREWLTEHPQHTDQWLDDEGRTVERTRHLGMGSPVSVGRLGDHTPFVRMRHRRGPFARRLQATLSRLWPVAVDSCGPCRQVDPLSRGGGTPGR